MSKINLWGEGFKTETFEIKALSLYNELELSILVDYFKDFIKEEKRKMKDKEILYFVIDIKKITESYKSPDFVEKLESAQVLLVDVLGEEYVRLLPFYSYLFTLPSLQYEISEYKKSLKKK